jgi:hypothetical protein
MFQSFADLNNLNNKGNLAGPKGLYSCDSFEFFYILSLYKPMRYARACLQAHPKMENP